MDSDAKMATPALKDNDAPGGRGQEEQQTTWGEAAVGVAVGVPLFAASALALVTGVSVVYSAAAFAVERRAMPVDASKTTLPFKVVASGSERKDTIVFMHGWPDDLNLFDDVIAVWSAAGYECAVMTIPNYPLPPGFAGDNGNVPPRGQGFTFREVADMMRSTIRKIVGGSERTVTLCAHDWGAVFSYVMLQELGVQGAGVHRLITLDVGIPHHAPLSFKFFEWTYQGFLNAANLMHSRGGGGAMTRALARAFGHPQRANGARVDASMDWPYRRFWAGKSKFGGTKELRRVDPPPKGSVKWLFAHGSKRAPAMLKFFDKQFLESVRESSSVSRVDEYGGGHWFFLDAKRGFAAKTLEWLDQTN